jgi:hypothetical protein
MRYYDISITPKGGTSPSFAWGSHPGGRFDPGALNVMFDMPVIPYGVPVGGQTVIIEGVPLEVISQANDFVGSQVVIRGGMQKGLPLANPAQAGVLVSGEILQSFGNWEGTEMSLSIVVYPSRYTQKNKGNIVLNWRAGQPLAEALRSCLSIAYPDMPISINIGSNLVLDNDEPHAAGTLDALADYIGDFTEQHFQQRVTITIQAGKIVIYDRTYQPSPIQINFTDLIGQPTWVEPKIMQMKTVMRADLQIGSIITMPKGMQNTPGLVATWPQSMPSSVKYQSAFQNDFFVREVRHIGNFRSPDSSDWCTVLSCVTEAP